MKTILRHILWPATLVLLAGCATTAFKPVPDALVATSYGRGDSDANQPTTTVLDRDHRDPSLSRAGAWWASFGDPRLDRLVERVIAVNGDLASAGLRLQRAQASANLARAGLWPRLDGSATASASAPLSGDGETSRSYQASAGIGWEIDLWGKLRSQRDVAAWDAEATAEDREATALALVSETASLYWTLAFINQRLAAGAETLARAEKTYALVQVQYSAGAVSRIELREAEQAVLSQQSSLLALEQQRVEARNALTVLMDGTPWPVDDEPRTLAGAVSPDVQPGLPAELLGRRPDLRAAELRLRGALAGIHIARTSYYPTFSLSGSAGGSSTSLADVLSDPVASLGVGLALPFLDWPQRKFDTEAARVDYAIAVNEFRKAMYTAFTEVDNALSAKERLAGQVALASASLAAAAQAEDLYEVRYRAGAVALRVWLDAQQTRRDAELALAQWRLDQLGNDVKLMLALGGTDVSGSAGAAVTMADAAAP